MIDDEVLDIGGKRLRRLDTPHVPHNWAAGVMYEETTGTLFSSDIFTRVGASPALTENDERAMGFVNVGPSSAATLRRLGALKPKNPSRRHVS